MSAHDPATGQDAPAHPAPDFARWQADGHRLAIEYSLDVLEELRQASEQAFQKIPHGGVEIGALLLGDHHDGLVRVLEWRTISCDYSRGPGFALSDAGLRTLADLIGQCAQATELRGLEAVGWFHTHTRSSLHLSTDDLAIHEQFFPRPWHIAFMMRPVKDQPTVAGFFFREANGALRTESSHREFVVTPDPPRLTRPRRPTAEPPPRIGPQAAASSPEHTQTPARIPVHNLGSRYQPRFGSREPDAEPLPSHVDVVLPHPDRRPELPDEIDLIPTSAPRGRGRSLMWRFLLALVTLAAASAAVYFSRPYWPGATAQSVALRVEGVDDQLVIRWDHAAWAVRNADAGLVQILDGPVHRDIPLTTLEARRGSVTWVRYGDEVEVRLHLYRDGKMTVQEFTRFVGAPRPKSDAPSQTLQERQQLLEERDQLRESVSREETRGRRLQDQVRQLEGQAKQ